MKLIKNKVMTYSDKPLKKYGKEMPAATMAKGPYMMSGKMQPPALLMKCGMKRYGKKK